MEKDKIFFHSNLRLLRERKRLSQEELGAKLGLSRIKLQQLEMGKTKNPAVIDLVNFSGYFGISVDTFLKIDLSKVGELKLRELEAGNDPYMTGTQLRVLPITVDRENRENIEYVPHKAKAGYQAGLSDPEYIAGLPKLHLPNLPTGKSFRMFPTEGDSMLPIPEGADILATYVENWKEIKPGTLCIVILKGQDFVFKKVTLQKDNTFQLVSLNETYQPYSVQAADVLEIWEFYSYHTKQIPAVAGNDELIRMVSEIHDKLIKS